MDIKRIKEIENILKQNNAYIHSSIEGRGCHIGRFKGIGFDAEGDWIIEVDIDSGSCTR